MASISRRRGTSVDKQIGLRLRMIRIERGMSQEDLGAKLGISFQQVQKYESGANAIASTHLNTLFKALRIKATDLLGELDSIPEGIQASNIALSVGIRVEKLGPKARAAMFSFLDLVEHTKEALCD